MLTPAFAWGRLFVSMTMVRRYLWLLVSQVKIRGPRQNYESAGAIDDFRGVVPPLVGAISG
jgi:hypothetical protein